MHTEWKTIKKGNYLYGLVKEHPNSTRHGYVLEHRLEMEKYLGRYLTKEEVVHHIDENRHNNHISNLRLMDYYTHNNLHKKLLKMESRICPVCNVEFIRKPKGKYDIGRVSCCSRSCNGKRSKRLQLEATMPSIGPT